MAPTARKLLFADMTVDRCGMLKEAENGCHATGPECVPWGQHPHESERRTDVTHLSTLHGATDASGIWAQQRGKGLLTLLHTFVKPDT